MLYYRVVMGDMRDWFSGFTTVYNELVTPKERNRMFRYLGDDVFQPVNVSKKKIYWCFGARFEKGTNHNENRIDNRR